MAKITQVLARVDEARPNAFDSLLKVKWLATLDGRIAANIYRLQHSELAQFSYDGTDLDIELLVPFPHDDIYDLWLIAQIDMANGEYNKYQNSMAVYNAAFDNFAHWFCSTYDPAQGYDEDCCDCGYRPPYFLTAYGLAVKAGFQGTEEEWLKSLVGKEGQPGDRVELRYEGDQIQWRYIPVDGDESKATEWVDLLDVAAIRGEIMEQTLAAAQASAEDARVSVNAAYAARSAAEEAAQRAEQIAADLLYKPIGITSFNAKDSASGKSTLELGTEVKGVTFSWSFSKKPVSVTFDGNSISADTSGTTLSGLSINSNQSWSLSATDERNAQAQASAGLTFLRGVYYGVLPVGAPLNSTAILSLTRSLQSGRGVTFTTNAGVDQRIAYALPANGYGTPAFKDKDTGFQAGFYLADTVSFTNASGHTEDYNVWLSTNTNLGAMTVVVS